MISRIRRLCWLMSAVAAPAMAQQGDPAARPLAAVQSCRTVADAAARLACYDGAVDALIVAVNAKEIVVMDRGEVRTARRGLFGFSLPRLPFLEGRGETDEDSRIVLKVVSSRRFQRDQWRFTLEDGAVWETTEVSRGFDDPQPGAMVTIERGTLGAYHAVVGKRGRARVRRIQ